MKQHLASLEEIYLSLTKSITKLDNADLSHMKTSAKIGIEKAISQLKSILKKNSELFQLYSHGRGDYSFEGAGHEAVKYDLELLIAHITD